MANPVTEIAVDDHPSSEGCIYDHENATGRLKFFNDLVRLLYIRIDVQQFNEPLPPGYGKLRETMTILDVQPSPRAPKLAKTGNNHLITFN